MLKVILFYKYTDIENPEEFRKEHLDFCNSIGLKGRILVATEGINGSVSGTDEQIESYKKHISSDKRFLGIEFKEEDCISHPFNVMKVKIKPELVKFRQSVSYKDAGEHLSPADFLKMSQDPETIILDARNEYESRVGKFKGAITPKIDKFQEFPKVAEDLKDKKDKKILMYCTGGIRCEKASAFMKSKGFKKVYQLHGGILNFAKEHPDTIWEGKCFVFDKRLLSDVNNKEEKPLTQCQLCNIDCDLYKRCRNPECNKLSVICIECEKSLAGCCSKECYDILFKQQMINF